MLLRFASFLAMVVLGFVCVAPELQADVIDFEGHPDTFGFGNPEAVDAPVSWGSVVIESLSGRAFGVDSPPIEWGPLWGANPTAVLRVVRVSDPDPAPYRFLVRDSERIPPYFEECILFPSLCEMTGTPFSLISFRFAATDLVDSLTVSGMDENGAFSQTFVGGVHFNKVSGVVDSTLTLSGNRKSALYEFTIFGRGPSHAAAFDNFNVVRAPEPPTLLLLGAGLSSLALARRRRGLSSCFAVTLRWQRQRVLFIDDGRQ